MTENLYIGADLYIGQEITVVTDPDVPHLDQRAHFPQNLRF